MTIELQPEFPHRTRKREPLAPGTASRATVPYVELHAHSSYSFLDGASLPEELAIRAAELGYTALALTDHDGIYGSLEFARVARDCGVRAITGAEVTVAGGSHITLLVETPRGYANLCRILTEAHAGTRPPGREDREPATKSPVRASGPVEGVRGNREASPTETPRPAFREPLPPAVPLEFVAEHAPAPVCPPGSARQAPAIPDPNA